MKPPPFEYFVPETVSEALDLLHQRVGDAKVLAGGQSLLPMLNLRLIRPAVLVDVNAIGELAHITQTDQMVAIGAGTRQSRVLLSDEVSRTCPLLSEAAAYIGHPAIRNRGTVGGSIAHADPAAELAIVAAAMSAELVLSSSGGQRTVKADEFFVTYLTTALEPDELLMEVRFPALGPRTGWCFQEVSRRYGDFAIAAAAVTVTLDEQNRCQDVRVAVGAVGGTPIRASAVEQAMTNAEPVDASFVEAAQAVKGEIDPSSDLHASAEYRSDITAVLVQRALKTAAERAGAR